MGLEGKTDESHAVRLTRPDRAGQMSPAKGHILSIFALLIEAEERERETEERKKDRSYPRKPESQAKGKIKANPSRPSRSLVPLQTPLKLYRRLDPTLKPSPFSRGVRAMSLVTCSHAVRRSTEIGSGRVEREPAREAIAREQLSGCQFFPQNTRATPV